ncbi:hypothetical protein [Streptomyces sp. NPDC005485]|uniref:hypothetical protein n=1 Tax=Streptomyces sp. NPDC005485 TaxID=3155591 RepID=UPI0033A5C20D
MSKAAGTGPSAAAVRFGGAVMLLMACLIGGFCVPALPYSVGLTGTRGTLTVDGYQHNYSSRGETTSSNGTFRSADGGIVDLKATVEPDYDLGRRIAVSRAPWTYYVVSPACLLGWLAGTCFAVCCLLLGLPGLIFGTRWNRRTRPTAVPLQIRVAKTAFYGALGAGAAAVIVAIAT